MAEIAGQRPFRIFGFYISLEMTRRYGYRPYHSIIDSFLVVYTLPVFIVDGKGEVF
jgi:hypothetical protein